MNAVSVKERILARLSSASVERLRILHRCATDMAATWRQPAWEKETWVGVRDVRNALDEVGIKTGDVVLMHSGLSQTGGGAKAIRLAGEFVNAVLEHLGPSGTLIMNTDSIRNAWDHAVLGNVFDFASWPSRRGLISEVFRRRPGAIRSVHPWYNVTALGSLAGDLLAAHHLSTPYAMDQHSPWFKLTAVRGKVVLFGIGYQWNSSLHLAEYMHPQEFPRAVFLDRPVMMRYMTRERREARMPLYLHASVWKPQAEARFGEYLQKKYALYTSTTLPNGESIIAYDAAAQYRAVTEEMRRDVTWYDPPFWPDARRET